MKIDRHSLSFRLLLPIVALIALVSLCLLLLVSKITKHIEEDFQEFTVKAAASHVTTILDMAVADLTTAKLTGNPFVAEAKKKMVLAAIRDSWSRSRQNGVITGADSTVILSTLPPETTQLLIARRVEGTFSLPADRTQYLCLSNFFPLWSWNITTIAEKSMNEHADSEVALILPGIALAILLLAAGLSAIFHRHLRRPVANLVASVGQGREVALTGISEFDRIVAAINDAFRHERERSAELKESEERIVLLLNSAAEGIYGIDLQGNCTFCNSAALRLLGFAHPDELLHKNIHRLVHHSHPDGRPFPEEECPIYRCYQTGEGKHTDHEIFWRGDGTSFPVEYWAQPIRRDGQLVGAVAAFVDISERQQAAEALLASERRFREIIEKMPLIGVLLDREGRIILCNDRLLAITGWSREEVLHKSWFEVFVSPETRAEVEDGLLLKSIQNGTIADHFENAIVTRQGEQRLVYWNNTVFRDQAGTVSGVASIGEDITQRTHLENQLRQAQKMESIGTLAGGIAHDFNNILSAIIGYTSLALMRDGSDPNKPWQDDLRQVRKASDRAAELVRQILTFSRKQQQEKMPLQLSVVVKEALKLLRASIPTTIEIRQNIASTATVLADPTQMHQMIMNLCTNAYHAMMEQGGILEVTLQEIAIPKALADSGSELPNGPYLKLAVTDTGCGMNKETITKIFDPYFTTKEAGKGTGLGLAVVHGVVKSHQGRISVYSEVGQGTTFTVYLPMITKEAKAEKVEAAPPRSTAHERIMVVDDEETIRNLAQEILTQAGYRVDLFTNGLEAWQAFAATPHHWQLLLTDQTMPAMTGDQLMAKALALRPDLPVILCSGYNEILKVEQARKAGEFAYLEKPIGVIELLTQVAKSLGLRRETL